MVEYACQSHLRNDKFSKIWFNVNKDSCQIQLILFAMELISTCYNFLHAFMKYIHEKSTLHFYI